MRATNLIETALAKTAGELKRDKYLGDADWNVVFRCAVWAFVLCWGFGCGCGVDDTGTDEIYHN